MTNQGVNFQLPLGGQFSVAVDSGAVGEDESPGSRVNHVPVQSYEIFPV
jgi:hypothetical protein